jgi:hypothetical protein
MKTILSTLMLLFFLMGQINLTLAAHYCGDELKSTQITVAPESHDCCDTSSNEKADPDCCNDQLATSDSDQYFGKASFQVDLSPEFVLAYILTFESLFVEESSSSHSVNQVLDRTILDLCILHQSFLI